MSELRTDCVLKAMPQRAQTLRARLAVAGGAVGLLRALTSRSQCSAALAFEYRGAVLSSRLCQLLATPNAITDKNMDLFFPPKLRQNLAYSLVFLWWVFTGKTTLTLRCDYVMKNKFGQ